MTTPHTPRGRGRGRGRRVTPRPTPRNPYALARAEILRTQNNTHQTNIRAQSTDPIPPTEVAPSPIASSTPHDLTPAHTYPPRTGPQLSSTSWVADPKHIFQCKTPILRHIPNRVRPEVRGALTTALWDTVRETNQITGEKAFLRLLMLPKCLLMALPTVTERATRNGTIRTNIDILRERVQLWMGHETQSLWEKVTRNTTRRSKHHDPSRSQQEANQRRAVELAREGALGKAVRALSSNGIHMPSEDTNHALLHKHPQTIPANDARDDLEPEHQAQRTPHIPPVTPLEIRNTIKRFPRGSAAGGSGLTPAHLRELTISPDSNAEGGLIDALAAFATFMLRGKGPARYASWFAGAPVTPLRKADGGVRPIAVGETLRRLVAAIALSRITEKVKQHVGPHQVGVCTKGGAEATIHAVRDLVNQLGHKPDVALLQIDLNNAFNRVSRRAFIRETTKHFPELTPWVTYCYGPQTTPHLWTPSFSFRSVQGVQQGDPLGPLLFSLALQPILNKVTDAMTTTTTSTGTNPSSALVSFYLDDGVLLGTHRNIQKALTILESPTAKTYGLHLTMTKSHLWWPTPPSTADRNAYPSNLPIQTGTGTMVLQAPIGTNDFVATRAQEQAKTKAQSLRPLTDLDDAHVTFALLRTCFGATHMNYMLRTTPSTLTRQACQTYDAATADVTRFLAGGVLSDATLAEMRLPVRLFSPESPHFGTGLTATEKIRHAAYLSSITSFYGLSRKLVKARDLMALHENHHATAAHTFIKSQLAQDDPPLRTLEQIETSGNSYSQHHLSDIIHKATIRRLELGCARTIAFRQSLALPGAKDWLRCDPTPAFGTHISNHDFHLWFAYYARRPLFNTSPTPRCIRSRCTKPMDRYGDHLLVCTNAAKTAFSPIIRRHDQQVRLLAADLRRCARSPRVEPHLYNTRDRQASSRPDILALGDHGGEDILDIAFAHLFCSPDRIRRNRHSRTLTLNDSTNDKYRQHAELARSMPGSKIIPITLSVTGGWHQTGYKYMRAIATEIATRQGEPKSMVLARMFQRHAARAISSAARCLSAGAP